MKIHLEVDEEKLLNAVAEKLACEIKLQYELDKYLGDLRKKLESIIMNELKPEILDMFREELERIDVNGLVRGVVKEELSKRIDALFKQL